LKEFFGHCSVIISQCPYKFSSFLDLRNASNRFRLFLRDFWLFRFFFPGSACFSSLASPWNLPSWVKYHGKFEIFGKEFRCTKFIAVERVTLSTALKFRPKFFWKWSFFDQKQQLLNNVEPFERILRALLIAQCPYKFSSFLDLRNASNRFRLFARDFRLFRFFFSRSACFSKVAPPENLQSWVKYHGKSESFGKEFRWTKFNAVERVNSGPNRT